MKIYYAASIWGAPGDADFNRFIIAHLKTYGQVLSEQLFLPDYKGKEHLDMRMIHDRDIAWVTEADRIIADVSVPSLGVGYELAYAVHLHKPVLALWKRQEGKRLSAMIAGSPSIQVLDFSTLTEACEGISTFFRS